MKAALIRAIGVVDRPQGATRHQVSIQWCEREF